MVIREGIAIQTYRVVVHEAEEGGYWAEVLDLPGCVSQGESLEELRENIREAIAAVTEQMPASDHLEFIEDSRSPVDDESSIVLTLHSGQWNAHLSWTETH